MCEKIKGQMSIHSCLPLSSISVCKEKIKHKNIPSASLGSEIYFTLSIKMVSHHFDNEVSYILFMIGNSLDLERRHGSSSQGTFSREEVYLEFFEIPNDQF